MESADSVRGALAEALTEAFLELLASSGIVAAAESTALDPADPLPRISSGVSFVSESVKGGMAVHLPLEVLQKTHPTNPGSATDSQLTDWSGELTNQLVGRLKNKLLRYRLTILVGIPAVMKRVNKKVLCTRAAVGSWHQFECGELPCHLKFETVIEQGYQLQQATAEEMPVDEGETMLF